MKLHFNTVSPLLQDVLEFLMQRPELAKFRLVGGTSLSLQLGHRISTDIDLFTDAAYGSIDFDAIDRMLRNSFAYFQESSVREVALGRPYFVGKSEQEAVKLDIYYADKFLFDPIQIKNIRLADPRDIVAMKLETIVQVSRKKDFWDLHELMEHFTIREMISCYKQRYPFGYDENEVFDALLNISSADDDLNPVCIKSKFWELIKFDLIEAVELLGPR
jgi:predicted nucleotidyltransferase